MAHSLSLQDLERIERARCRACKGFTKCDGVVAGFSHRTCDCPLFITSGSGAHFFVRDRCCTQGLARALFHSARMREGIRMWWKPCGECRAGRMQMNCNSACCEMTASCLDTVVCCSYFWEFRIDSGKVKKAASVIKLHQARAFYEKMQRLSATNQELMDTTPSVM